MDLTNNNLILPEKVTLPGYTFLVYFMQKKLQA